MSSGREGDTGGYHEVYYDRRGRRRRIAPGQTPTVQRHYQETTSVLELHPGDRVLELGCGLGRFTRLLVEAGLDVTAVDLAPSLVETLAAELPQESGVELVCCPAETVRERVSGSFRAVVGFFFLHHLRQLEPVCRAAWSMLEPGGRVAFCEPNALNPLYYVQVTLTPGMSWRGEVGLPLMRAGRVFPAMTAAGLDACHHHLYGVLPPCVANTRAGGRLDRMLEAVLPQRVTTAYGVFAAERRQ